MKLGGRWELPSWGGMRDTWTGIVLGRDDVSGSEDSEGVWGALLFVAGAASAGWWVYSVSRGWAVAPVVRWTAITGAGAVAGTVLYRLRFLVMVLAVLLGLVAFVVLGYLVFTGRL